MLIKGDHITQVPIVAVLQNNPHLLANVSSDTALRMPCKSTDKKLKEGELKIIKVR